MAERSMPGTRARPASVGTPRIVAYEWGKHTYPWAIRRLKLAEAEHGAPPQRGRIGRPRKHPAVAATADPVPAAPAERCGGCSYLVTSPGHLAVCGETS
jgi:hypothetical protein